ncbi:hypothetical protein ATANTOWER_019304 [Ataeniobius toweri]|uniref:Uncharacterized protein n=1 Tax=Ataeniobius toweri TaxID=208326 RepID=A0ABU7AYN5_9TELE|nr:hypothetical protein [Ataeniobius toweri]
MITSLGVLKQTIESGFVYCNAQASKGRMETFFQQLTQGNALLLIVVLGIGGSFQAGYHITGLSSPSPVRKKAQFLSFMFLIFGLFVLSRYRLLISSQYIQRFINSSWYDRYNEPPSPQKVTMIWSLIVSIYAVGGLFGAVSVKFFSQRLGRCVCSLQVYLYSAFQ